MKQVTGLRYIYKIDTVEDKDFKIIKKQKWTLDIKSSDSELIAKRELIGLADSQGFRFIKEIAKIKDKNEKTDFRKYIVAIVFETKKDFDEACKLGVTINGIKYLRFVGTPGGIKKSTILFVNEEIYDELNKRANNGRDITVKMVSAKFEAYKALMFSTSIPVTMPKGIAVVKDCITHFKEDTIFINDVDENGKTLKEPTVEIIKDMDINLNITDGFGLVKPKLMLQWTKDVLGTNDVTFETMFSGVCGRNSFLKGMIYAWDIDLWIDEYNNGDSIVTDVWGNKIDLRECELILTEGMLKLWSSYKSLDDYLQNCKENNYTFAVCKTAEKEIDCTRRLNYQYLQSFEMSEKDMIKLVTPTINKIKDSICGDYKTTLKYIGVKEKIPKEKMKEFSFKEALAWCPKLMNDEYVIKRINNMIKKQIDETKIGKIEVRGNYQLVSGDPFILMESLFNDNPKGLLKKGQFYSSFWDELNVDEVLLMRSPMTVHNNIVKGNIMHSEECRKWYKYMKNIMIINAWDNTMSAENGMD